MYGLGFAIGMKTHCPRGTGSRRNKYRRNRGHRHSLDWHVLASGRLQTARRTPDGRSNPSGVEAPPRRLRQRRRYGFRLSSLAPRATMLAKGPSCMSNGTTAVVAAVESLPFGVATTDVDGNITWANAAYALLSGCTPVDLVGQ